MLRGYEGVASLQNLTQLNVKYTSSLSAEFRVIQLRFGERKNIAFSSLGQHDISSKLHFNSALHKPKKHQPKLQRWAILGLILQQVTQNIKKVWQPLSLQLSQQLSGEAGDQQQLASGWLSTLLSDSLTYTASVHTLSCNFHWVLQWETKLC